MKLPFCSNNLWQVWQSHHLDLFETDMMVDPWQLTQLLLPSLQEQIASFREIAVMNVLAFSVLFYLTADFDVVKCSYFECLDNFLLQLLLYSFCRFLLDCFFNRFLSSAAFCWSVQFFSHSTVSLLF